MKNFRKLFPLALLTVFTLFLNTACNKDDMDDLDEMEELTTSQTTNGVVGFINRTNGGGGDPDCFEINYPVTVLFPDGTSQSVNSDDELYAAVEAWYDANEDLDEHPTLELPITVTLPDGTPQTIDTETALEDLLDDCFDDHDDGDDYGDDDCDDDLLEFTDCFTFVFPLDILTANGTVNITDEDMLIEVWEELEANDEEADLVYPVSIVLEEDGSTVEINDEEELEDVFEACWDGYDDDDDFGHEECFEFIFPFDILTDNGTITITDEAVLEATFEDLDDDDADFELVFPLQVKLIADGTEVDVTDEAALEAILEACEE